MTIETKYNIGDEVWFTTLSRKRKGNILGIKISVIADDWIEVEYSVGKSRFHWTRRGQDLFPTKEELLKSL